MKPKKLKITLLTIKIGAAAFSKTLFFDISDSKFENIFFIVTISGYISTKSREFFYEESICFSNVLCIFSNRNNKIPLKPSVKVAFIILKTN